MARSRWSSLSRTTQPSVNTTEHAGRGLLDRRLVFLLGKGGVGRSTLSAALGLLAARRGGRAIVVEVSGRGDIPRLFRRRCEAGVETELEPGLWTLDVDPRRALEEYLHDQLPLRVIADVLGSSTTFGIVAAATPGLRELLTVGKIWELAGPERRVRRASPYDLVVVDAPATGHGLALLEAPRTFASAAAVGPIAHQGRRIAATLSDRAVTALVGVATPERAAIDELIGLRAALGGSLDAELVNAVTAERFTAADVAELRAAAATARLAPGVRDALAATIAAESRAGAQQLQIARLDAPVELPFIAASQMSVADLETLADRLVLAA